MKTLTPTYNRDYTSARAVRTDYLAGKDFILHDIRSQWHNKPCSSRDFPGEQVKLRYADLKKVTLCTWERS